MTVAELIEQLQDMPQDAEVRLAEQPSWPFEFSVRNVVSSDDVRDEFTGEPALSDNAVWLVEGQSQRYLPRAVRDVAW